MKVHFCMPMNTHNAHHRQKPTRYNEASFALHNIHVPVYAWTCVHEVHRTLMYTVSS